MSNLPQSVTIRYTHDLLFAGSNYNFAVEEVIRHPHIVNNFVVGQYFDVRLSMTVGTFTASGATPSEACRRALEHFGVTFK